MALQDRVKLKNLQMINREIELKLFLKNQMKIESRTSNLLVLIVMPVCVGFLAHRLSGHPLGAQVVRALLSLGI